MTEIFWQLPTRINPATLMPLPHLQNDLTDMLDARAVKPSTLMLPPTRPKLLTDMLLPVVT
jgi:hypothetical protein